MPTARAPGPASCSDAQGHIITNNHVVAGAADTGTIKVVSTNGTEIDATIVGRDASYDLAVLKIGPLRPAAAAAGLLRPRSSSATR